MIEKKALVGNAADVSQVKEAAKTEKNRRASELQDVKGMLSTVPGRRFLWRLLGECGVYKLSYAGNGQNDETNFNEGRKNVGLKLLADIMEADPSGYITMQNEAIRREENG